MLKHVWNLQLFAEGADAGASEGAPDGTVVETGDDAQTNEGVNSADAEQNVTENPETKVSFDDLIEGEYKDDYKKKVNKIVRQRLKGTQQELDNATSTLDAMQPMLQILADKYKVDDYTDIDAIIKSIENDNAMLEDEALERGMDVDTLRQIKSMERENNRLKAEKQQSIEEQQRQEKFARIAQEGEELKNLYPNFDLDAEISNPETGEQFVKMLEFGFTVQNAFESLHLAELQNITNEAITAKAVEKVANNVKANQKRPSENGLNNQTGSKVSKDISSLSREEIDDIIARANSGETITLQ